MKNRYQDRNSLLNAIDNIPYVSGGSTNITAGLVTLRNQIFGQNGDRYDAANRAVIITDGPAPDDSSPLQSIMNRLQGDGVTTLSVGITEQATDDLLRLLSSQPKQVRTHLLTGFTFLNVL